jgi:nucleoside phosphorylase
MLPPEHGPAIMVAPTREEWRVLRRALAPELAAGKLRLEECGVGPENAAALCRRLEDEGWRGSLFLAGWAGGLSADLAAGSVVLARSALSLDGPPHACQQRHLPGARVGDILTVSRALYTPEEKRRATATGALAVEMEAYPIAAWAEAQGLPFIHARVVLDAADERLPDLSHVVDESGRLRWLALGRHPSLLLELARLYTRLRRLNPILARLARQLVRPG